MLFLHLLHLYLSCANTLDMIADGSVARVDLRTVALREALVFASRIKIFLHL